jgi:hypothetical protein
MDWLIEANVSEKRAISIFRAEVIENIKYVNHAECQIRMSRSHSGLLHHQCQFQCQCYCSAGVTVPWVYYYGLDFTVPATFFPSFQSSTFTLSVASLISSATSAKVKVSFLSATSLFTCAHINSTGLC